MRATSRRLRNYLTYHGGRRIQYGTSTGHPEHALKEPKQDGTSFLLERVRIQYVATLVLALLLSGCTEGLPQPTAPSMSNPIPVTYGECRYWATENHVAFTQVRDSSVMCAYGVHATVRKVSRKLHSGQSCMDDRWVMEDLTPVYGCTWYADNTAGEKI